MNYAIYVSEQDYTDLKRMIPILGKLIFSVDQAKQEDKLYSRFKHLISTEKESGEAYASPLLNEDTMGFLKFTEQEILKMPKSVRKYFRMQGKIVHYRERTGGRYKKSYEVRYAKKPFNKPPISVSATTLEKLKERFLEKLNNYILEDDITPTVPSSFDGFSMYWFENFHKRKVKEQTYKNNFDLYNRHIKAKFEKYSINAILPAMVQDMLENLPGNGKTADDVHSILNQIFDTAVDHGKLKKNPLNFFVHEPHEKETGVELTRDEELTLLNAYSGTVYEIIFAVMLYTGLRPNEYKTARIKGNFIVAVNSKRKSKTVEYKKIPICCHLRSRLADIAELPKRHIAGIRDQYKKIYPNHTLKDLRKTFDTRCVECKIDYYARKMFVGQSVGKLDKTYIGNLDDFLLTEGKKLNNWYSLYPKNTPNPDK